MKLAIEKAIEEAAPELERIEVEGVVDPAAPAVAADGEGSFRSASAVRERSRARRMAENDESGEESARSAQVIRQFAGLSRPAAGGARAGRGAVRVCGQLLPARHSHVVHIERRQPALRLPALLSPFLLGGSRGREGQSGAGKRFSISAKASFPRRSGTGCRSRSILAFFFFNSSLGRTVVFYPSPAGATESLLPLETWEELVREHPRLATLKPGMSKRFSPGNGLRRRINLPAAFIVPIDACYELVGIVRRTWKGFHGGEEAWQAIAAFLQRPSRAASTA